MLFSILIFMLTSPSVFAKSDGPLSLTQAQQITRMALTIPREKLLEKDGSISCTLRATDLHPEVTAYASSVEKAHMKAGFLCIQKSCENVSAAITKKSMELLKRPKLELAEYFVSVGYSAKDAIAAVALAENNPEEFRRVLEANSLNCNNSDSAAVFVETACFMTLMACE